MKHFSKTALEGLNSEYKRNFLNQISGIKPVFLIATKSASGVSNLAVFNSIMHIGASPLLLGFILRPTSVERHTYENIKETKNYTLNAVTCDLMKQAHQSSARYPKDVSEFEACGIEEEWRNTFPIPFVKKSPIQIAMRLLEEYEIKSNSTRLLIGQAEDVYIPEGLLEADGHLKIQMMNLLNVSGLDAYFKTQFIERLSYARP